MRVGDVEVRIFGTEILYLYSLKNGVHSRRKRRGKESGHMYGSAPHGTEGHIAAFVATESRAPNPAGQVRHLPVYRGVGELSTGLQAARATALHVHPVCEFLDGRRE